MDLTHKRLLVIVGPTAVGKTEVAIKVAEHFKTEIISADSRQFFKELIIGTAKPNAEELSRVKHHFINSHAITEEYDAARYAGDALTFIYKLFERHDYLVVCGGSGLYIKALLEGFDDIPEVPDNIRDEIIAHYETEGLEWLQTNLQELDPAYWQKVDQQNPARLMRALEVVMATGKSISSFQTKQKQQLPFQVIKIGLELDRELLYKRIDARMDEMIAKGLFEEAKAMYPYRHHQALQTVGYKEIFDFLDGQYDREEAVRLLKRNTRRYAKRQFTWFKRDTEITWVKPNQWELIVDVVNK
ncbi:MAG: tRNA (adenosine(37)-N6)-dimethylallyltransferase MiaA [Cyclobacteriaceae bacterium]|nr:tRNA (adenosine(37)-N6)-dimethylallyltransferase MiaA [Cyclobacteriaceae bacterium]UYN88120.1 MAG: tRNA (adenosine(37)-N6)-dimethylallyltransferase MiaA [Cyclobacteriaceae bacterium]